MVRFLFHNKSVLSLVLGAKVVPEKKSNRVCFVCELSSCQTPPQTIFKGAFFVGNW